MICRSSFSAVRNWFSRNISCLFTQRNFHVSYFSGLVSIHVTQYNRFVIFQPLKGWNWKNPFFGFLLVWKKSGQACWTSKSEWYFCKSNEVIGLLTKIEHQFSKSSFQELDKRYNTFLPLSGNSAFKFIKCRMKETH